MIGFHSSHGRTRFAPAIWALLLALPFVLSVNCSAQERSPIRDHIEQEDGMPSRTLVWAYERYVGRSPARPNPGPEVIENVRVDLRLFVLRKTPDYVGRNRARIVQERWSKAFIADFDAAIRDMDSTRAGDPEAIRRAGLAWRDKADAASRHLGRELISIASRRGSLAALHELAQIGYAEDPSTSGTPSGTLYLWTAADKEHGPAQVEMMERHFAGDALSRDVEKSYYWGLRAHRNGFDVDGRLAEIGRLLTAGQRRKVEEWISTNAWVRP